MSGWTIMAETNGNPALPALGVYWGVLYRSAPAAAPRVRDNGASAIVLGGDVSDHPACVSALRRWLMRRARQTLPDCLERVAAETRLDFATVSIRGQRSRWGSCSATGDISLNYQLLFLPPHLLRHVLVHELCHTVELNHSPRFWRTVARFGRRGASVGGGFPRARGRGCRAGW